MAFCVGSGGVDGHGGGGGGGEQVDRVALTRKSLFFLCMSVTLLVLVVAIVVPLMI